jgi:Na+/proline symporter
MLDALDIGIVAAFLVLCTAIGLRHSRSASRDPLEYFLAGRRLDGWQAGISMAATQFAADTPLLVTGMIATAGVFSLWRLWIYALAFLLLGFVLAGPWRRARVLTDAELAEIRYGGRAATALRVVKAVYFGVVFNCTVLAMVLFATTRIAEPFLDWATLLPADVFAAAAALARAGGLAASNGEVAATNGLLSLVFVLGVTALYTTTGGLRAVVTTDLLQFAIALAASAAYAVVLVGAVGGLSALPGRLAALYGEAWTSGTLAFTPDLARDAGIVVLATVAIQWLAQMNADGTGYLAQRAMACRDDHEARRAAIVFVVAQVLVRSLVWLPIGLALLVLFPGDPTDAAAREVTFVSGVSERLPSGMRGLMVTGLIAALASTLDSHLNWGASYVTNDLYRPCVALVRGREPSERSLVRVARLANAVIVAIAIAVLGRLGSIQSAWHASLLLGAGMGVPLVLRWLWWRVTATAELTAILASSVAAPALIATVDTEGVRLLAITLVTTALVVGVSLLGSNEVDAARSAFYRRVRPPGFWGPVARACGEDPRIPLRTLADGLVETALAATALFTTLVAAGSWLVSSPPPVLLPSRPAWIALLGTTAVGALLALRRRLARGTDRERAFRGRGSCD